MNIKQRNVDVFQKCEKNNRSSNSSLIHIPKMPAELINGNEIAKTIRLEIKEAAAALKEKTGKVLLIYFYFFRYQD